VSVTLSPQEQKGVLLGGVAGAFVLIRGLCVFTGPLALPCNGALAAVAVYVGYMITQNFNPRRSMKFSVKFTYTHPKQPAFNWKYV
jgi:predicted tellurium resistance membrane protein TerC